MNVRTLPPNQHFAVPYYLTTATATATATGSVHSALSSMAQRVPHSTFRYQVISEFSTTVFVMDEAQLTAFRGGYANPRGYYARSEGQRHDQYFPYIPSLGPIYLVIVNFSPTQPTAVYYNVFNG